LRSLLARLITSYDKSDRKGLRRAAPIVLLVVVAAVALTAISSARRGATPLAPLIPSSPLGAPAALTQNQSETMAEQGLTPPGTTGQNVRETLGEQGIFIPVVPAALESTSPLQYRPLAQDAQPVAPRTLPTTMPQRPGGSEICVCPACGTRVPNEDGLMSCPAVRCQHCGHSMLPGVRVGEDRAAAPRATPRQYQPTAQQAQPVALPPPPVVTPQRALGSEICVCPACGTRIANEDGQMSCPAVPCQHCGHSMLPGVSVGQDRAASSRATSPTASGITLAATSSAAAGSLPSLAGTTTYSAAVADIVRRNCLRCHGGAIRNLGNYHNVKGYADNGLLMMMIQPGGPMSHFLTPGEAQQVIDWIEAGTPR